MRPRKEMIRGHVRPDRPLRHELDMDPAQMSDRSLRGSLCRDRRGRILCEKECAPRYCGFYREWRRRRPEDGT